MRTSNKILISLLLTLILIFTGLFLTVRIKYANGNMVERKNDSGYYGTAWSDEYKIKEPIKSVSISGQMDIKIIPSDSAKIVIGKMGDNLVRHRVKDGVLIVDMDTAKIHPNQNGETVVVFNHVELFLPPVDSIHVANSHIKLNNVADSNVRQPAYNFHLDLSELSVEGRRRDGQPAFYDKIKVDARNGSILHFQNNPRVNDIQVRLFSSRFEDGAGYFGKMNIQADSSSIINIQGHNLRKATITSTE